MSYNIKQKIIDNTEAIKVLEDNYDNNKLSPEQKVIILSRFSGFGGTKGVLNDWNATKARWEEDGVSKQDIALYDQYQELFEAVRNAFPFSEHKKVIDSIKNGVLTQFYTPAVVCSTFYEVLKEYTDIKSIYDPCAGAAVFLTEAFKVFPGIEKVCMYDKDILTSKIAESIISNTFGYEGLYGHNRGFEESEDSENGQYELLATNPPYGEFGVYDKEYEKDKLKKDFCKRIHNYFIAKSIDKLKEGGVGAWLITTAFLDTVSNKSIRQYLFEKCDFISLVVMSDNLMKNTGNTEAPSHFLVVQKNSTKTCLSLEEELLVESSFVEKDGKKYSSNRYIRENWKTCFLEGSKVVFGKNQYGKPSVEVHWEKSIEEIAEPFKQILQKDFSQRYIDYNVMSDPEFYPKDDNWSNDESPLDKEELDKELLDHCGETEFGNNFGYTIEPTHEFDIVMRLADGTIKIESYPVEPEHNLSDLLPKYVPFKDNIIVEYDTKAK